LAPYADEPVTTPKLAAVKAPTPVNTMVLPALPIVVLAVVNVTVGRTCLSCGKCGLSASESEFPHDGIFFSF
jgi:hypothetical protein